LPAPCHAWGLMLADAVCETKLVTKHAAKAGLCPGCPCRLRLRRDETCHETRRQAVAPPRRCRWPARPLGRDEVACRRGARLAAQAAGLRRLAGNAEANGRPLTP
jgi:hypothetical protein